MKIKITNFSDGIHYFDFTEPAKSLDLDEPFTGDVNVKVRMDKSHSQIVLFCDLTVMGNLVCDRCGADFQGEIKSSFILTYLFDKEQVESDDLNLYYLSPETDKIDIRGDVKEYARISVPMKILCSEDCRGLCPRCGKNLNEGDCDCQPDQINPVWSELLKLKKKDQDDDDISKTIK